MTRDPMQPCGEHSLGARAKTASGDITRLTAAGAINSLDFALLLFRLPNLAPSSGVSDFRRRVSKREPHLEGGIAWTRDHLNIAVVPLYDPLHCVKTKPGTFANRLRCEEGFKD